jgi:hypothetical protein
MDEGRPGQHCVAPLCWFWGAQWPQPFWLASAIRIMRMSFVPAIGLGERRKLAASSFRPRLEQA